MATTFKTPGVYLEEVTKFPPSVASVETAIPAFIGYTEKAKDAVDDDLNMRPWRISSLLEYETYFGGPQPEDKIEVVITDVMDAEGNVTGKKAVARVAPDERSPHLMHYALQLFFANGGGDCYIVSVANYKDIAKSELSDGLEELKKEDVPTLIVFPEAQNLSIADYATLHDKALLQCEELKDRFVIMDLHGDKKDLDKSDTSLRDAVDAFRASGIGTNSLKFGAVYAPNVETTIDLVYDEAKTKVTKPDGETATMDALPEDDNELYELAKAAIRDMSCQMPPSGAIAGVYARVDEERGVWKAPANVSLLAVTAPTIACTHEEQGDLNVDPVAGKSVNVIRYFTGKGTMVWGARTLAGNDNEWRYISVRRFFNMVEESAKKASEQFVFEPNDANTWVRVQAMLENYLTTLWRQGALQGVKPEHAFYVEVGLNKTMTALDVLEGRMIVEIGMAAVRPAEFIVLRFSHMMAQS